MRWARAAALAILCVAGAVGGAPAIAASCATAASAGAAPADWRTYCWFDFSSYNDAQARSAGGQSFTYNLPDGSVLSFVATVSSTAATALNAVAAPSWGGSAVGNSAFIGIPGKPVLYTPTNGSTVTVTFSGITLSPPAGVTGGATYNFVAADGESTNNGESLSFTTTGANWTVLDQVPPISGNTYPTTTNTGTTFTETGVGGTVGGYIVGSTNATTVTTTLVAGGKQGAMFAVRFASISLNKSLVGTRVNAADQFTYKISASTSGTTLGSATSSGSGNGPFGLTSSFISSLQSLTLSEAMAPGSVSTIASYAPNLTCTNSTAGSTTLLPNNVTATSYVLSSIAFGDNISCNFTNTAQPPILTVAKSAPSPGLKVGVNSVYTLTVTNTGKGPTTTAQVKDQLPANLTFVSATGTNWTCSNASQLVTCNFAGATLAAGGTSTIAVTVNAPLAAGGAADTNYASIDPSGGSSPPAPGSGCSPVASCASAGPNTVIYINPVADSGSAPAGTASTPIVNVVANDTVSGAAATLGASGNATVAQSGTWPAGIALNTTTGAITTTTAVPIGTYSVAYQLCDRNTPPDCATVTDTVTVNASIIPVADTGSTPAGTASTAIANVAANDTVNGAAATLGASGNATVAQSGTWPAGIALNTTTGAITTTAAVPIGTYSVAYQLCDRNTPPDCATVTDTVTVNASIIPVADTGSATAGTASTAIANVAANDTVNGAAATLGASGNATVAQSGTWPAGIALNTASGAVTTTAAVAPGTYSVAYQLCDRNAPPDCATVTDTVTVNASINPVADSGSVTAGTVATAIANVAANDSVNGSPATLGASGDATVSQSGTWPAGIALNTTTGAVTTTAAVAPGTYSVAYQLCDRNTPPDCATVTDTVTVAASILPVADSGSVTAGAASTAIANVAANDTVNGAVATLGAAGNAAVSQSGTWPAGIALNTTSGAVTTTTAVAPGTYSVAYQLCDKNAPPDCATVTDTVTVNASIIPVADTGSATAGTASMAIANVAANDTVNGAAATLGASGNATVAQSGSWPAGISLNSASGAVTVTAAVAPGTYSVAYQLCDRNAPPDCATVTDTVTVTASINPVADSGTVTAGTVATAIVNVAANDSVNGSPATLGASGNATVSQNGAWPAGIALNTTSGAITTTTAVAPGTYSVAYQLCDKNAPPDCATVTDTVTVNASIVPATDTGSTTAGTVGTAIANVAANDSVNGAPATLGPSGNATVAQSGSWPTGIALNTTSGAVTTTAAVAPGTYSVAYQLCDKNAPPDCATVTDTVTVKASIIPVADTGSVTAGAASTAIADVAANDSVNGSPATLGASGNATVSQSGTWPAGIALNTTSGAVTTTAAVAPGTYSVAYQLCDRNTPPDCATVTDTVTVNASIVPVAETGSVTAGAASTAIANVAANDSVNGSPATLGASGNATVSQSGAWPAGITLNTTTGAVTTTAAIAPGIYSVAYQLCDRNTPPDCATVTDTVTVNASINPVAVSGSVTAGTVATAIANVAANDSVNGSPATLGASGNATVSQSGAWPAGIALNTTTGAVTTTAAVAPGTYSVAYQLCDKRTPPDCATVTDTVTVAASILPVADSGSVTAGAASTAIANVAANDSVNGSPATLGASGNATVSQSGAWPAGIALNTASGAIAVTAAVAPGTYSVAYQLCDRNTPPDCATVTDTVTVKASIIPVAETGSATAGAASTAIANVAANDSVNGSPVTLGTSGNATVSQSGAWPAGIALNTTSGAITTTAAVAPGTYSVAYQLCDKNTPPDCATVTDMVTVNASIVPVADSGSVTAGTASTAIANVAANDTVNGAAATLGASGNATVAQSGTWPTGIALNTATGSVTTTAALAPGTYSVAYQLCDRNTPPNCATITDTVTVKASIIPIADSGTATSGTPSTAIADVAANDTVNGAAATLGAAGNAAVSQSGPWPMGIALNATTGAITTSAAVAPGIYGVAYQLCDRYTPPDCATVTDTVTVSASIVPVADAGAAVAGTASTPIVNVAANDTVNGAAAALGASSNATVAQSGTWPAGIALNSTTGAITTTAAVAPGVYSVAYQLCDRNTPPDCATITDTVTVKASINPVADTGRATAGTAATAIANVAANDTVNGVPATLGASGNAAVSQSGSWPTGVALNTTSGAVTTTSAVAPGTYSVAYQLCDRGMPPDCATVTDTVMVTASIVPVADAGTAVAGTASTPIVNVAANDSVNGAAATLGASGNAIVAQSGLWPMGITLNTTTGAIVTTAAVAPGTYTVAYQLCDRNTPPDCATAMDTVTVTASVRPVADSGSAVAGTAGTPIASVVGNDTVNGLPATLGAAANAVISQSGTWPAGITLNTTTGAITTTAAVGPGTYTVTYQLCDRNTPPDCATATDSVTVTASILPLTDTGSVVAGTAGTPIANVAANDTVNGAAATLGATGNATVAQSGTWPAGIALNPLTGAVTTAASVAPGKYTVVYQLCDRTTPPDCALMTDSVTVTGSAVPVSSTGTAVAGVASTPIANVAANGSVDGMPATLGPSGNATVSPNGNWPVGITLNTSTGAVTTAATVSPGTYSIPFVLCDRNTPPLCATATDTVTVKAGVGGSLVIEKSADRTQAEIGDSVQYRITVMNPGTAVVTGVTLKDALPLGFRLVPGTVLMGIDGAVPAKSPDPRGTPGPNLTWTLGNVVPGESVEVDYRVRITAGAERGNGTNEAQALGYGVASPVVMVRVKIGGGAFAAQACVVGKIYVDCNGNRVQDAGEPGIPGVRLYFEDGTNLTSDENGNYSICGQRPITHVLKVDQTTLPAGSRLVVLSNRNAGDGDSVFVDLRDGELHRADFAEGSCTNKVMDDVRLRQQHGALLAPLAPAGREHIGVEFESMPAAPDVLRVPAPQDTPVADEPAAEGGDAWQGTLPFGSSVAMTAGDATLGVAPLRETVPVAAAAIDGSSAAFRPVSQGSLNRFNSNLPVAADEGLWRQSRGLPIGSRIALHVSDAKLPADGHSSARLVVALTTANGRPIDSVTRVRVETSTGRLRAPDGKEAASFDVAVKNGIARLELLSPVTPGKALLRVSSGAVRVQGTVSFVPELRPLIATGIVETGLSAEHVTEDPNAPALASVGFEDSLQHWGSDPANGGSFWSAEGRAAGFVKGTVFDDVLLTGSYDSSKISQQRFFADVDPNQYFPISGDASLVNYDARSSSKLYLRLDRDESSILYGDFQALAPTDQSWLGSYARTLTGVTAHYETPQAKTTVFGAMTSTHQFVDEQPGRGISGPYAVSQANAVANSETVDLLVRDRNQPAVVLSRQVLTRYVDYDFEPFSGRIIFRQPVPSVDENLNPVSIRITYEVDNGGPGHLVDGANAELVVADGVSIGARAAQDHDPLTPFRLYGADSVWRIDRQTTLTVDVARSEGNQLYSASASGALAPVSTISGLTAPDPAGNAGRIELLHHDDALDARVYAGKADLTFENASASLSPGHAEAGAHATYRLSDSTQAVVDAQHTTDETTEAHRTGASLMLETAVWQGAKLQTGVNYVDQTYNSALPAVAQYGVGDVPGTANGAPLNNTGFGFAGGGLLGSPLAGALALPAAGAPTLVEQDYVAGDVKLTQKLNDRASVYGEYQHTLDGVSGQMAAVGGEYRVSESERFYARYEELDSLTGIYGLGDGSKVSQAVAGLDTSYMRDGTVYNELRLTGAESGQGAADALGVRNLWHLAPGLNATTAVERQEVINPVVLPGAVPGTSLGMETATALATGLEYVGSPLWKAAERLEYRFSDQQTNWLSTLTVTRKLSDDWTLIGRNLYLSAHSQAPGSAAIAEDQDRAQAGIAYRDTVTNTWNMLARYEYRTDYNNTPVTGVDTRTQIVAVVANFHPVRAWEFDGQLAARQVNEILNGAPSNYTAQLVAGRAQWDIDPRWDVGVLASTSSGGGSRDQGVALEVGRRVFDNLWVSVGAIAGRYADVELFSANSSWRGIYIRLRFKFDEKSFRLDNPAANRSLDDAASTERQ
jgi:uncharacterized repeat protein (TIGR01451 family)